ncbi:MAG: heavy-metal-associated domain-containing protein [Oscillospiraceae bacterium]|nr:heavy-metal-associated domain-containing protein [Oscillospiraceae bacterium]
MLKITAKISGMSCPMCEAHINDLIRNHFAVKKVTSSHKSGETVILTEQEITFAQISEALKDSGYSLTDVQSEPYVKKGLFRR